VPENALIKMDKIEGLRPDVSGNYCRATVAVMTADDVEPTGAVTYIGTQVGRERFQSQRAERQQVKKAYLDHLVAGATQFNFPNDYVQVLRQKAGF
jgi:hypothetical protein